MFEFVGPLRVATEDDVDESDVVSAISLLKTKCVQQNRRRSGLPLHFQTRETPLRILRPRFIYTTAKARAKIYSIALITATDVERGSTSED